MHIGYVISGLLVVVSKNGDGDAKDGIRDTPTFFLNMQTSTVFPHTFNISAYFFFILIANYLFEKC